MKIRMITCRFCNNKFPSDKYIPLLTDNSCCKECFERRKEEMPGSFGESVIYSDGIKKIIRKKK